MECVPKNVYQKKSPKYIKIQEQTASLCYVMGGGMSLKKNSLIENMHNNSFFLQGYLG